MLAPKAPQKIPVLWREFAGLRACMERVFTCDTAFGACKDWAPSAGHCLLSAMVVQELYDGDIRTSSVENVPHYWNRIPYIGGDGELEVDLTADQFGRDPVLIRRRLKETSLRFSRERGRPLPDKNPDATRLYGRFLDGLLMELDRSGLELEAKILRSGFRPVR
jgi:hypothetical protein